MKSTRFIATVAIITTAAVTLPSAQAQLPGLVRTDLLKQDLRIGGHETVQTRVDFAPGTVAPWHVHPGEELAYVLEGTLEYQIEGQAPITLKVGEALFIPAGASHTARNVGTGKASELATYIVDKGKPLVTIRP